MGFGDQLHITPILCDAIAAAQLRLHREGPIRSVRLQARLSKLLFMSRAADGFARYAIIARAAGAKGVRDDDYTWDLEHSSTQVSIRIFYCDMFVTLV